MDLTAGFLISNGVIRLINCILSNQHVPMCNVSTFVGLLLFGPLVAAITGMGYILEPLLFQFFMLLYQLIFVIFSTNFTEQLTKITESFRAGV